MFYRLVKARRYWAARLRAQSCSPLFWHVGTPNFGDDINVSLFESLSDLPMRFAKDRRRPHFMGMGSILTFATESSVVLGSGLLEPTRLQRPLEVVSLRGELSRQQFGLKRDIPLGDPMVLVNLLMSPERGDHVGFVPHVSSLPRLRRALSPKIKLIDVRRAPWEVVREIGRCKLILSQSLHGLIVADAFDIPNIWVAPGSKMVGGDFKFRDYFSTLDAPKESYRPSAAFFKNLPYSEAWVGKYRGNKTEYRDILGAALKRGLPS